VDDAASSTGYFTYTHVYTCAQEVSCSYKPKIFVEDNWEWCASGTWRCIGSGSNQSTPPTVGGLGWISYPNNVVVTSAASGEGTVAGPLTAAPSGVVQSCGGVGGPFSPSGQTYTVYNMGSATLNWTATVGQSWLSLTPVSGTLGPGASTQVTASLNSGANSLPIGTHVALINFTNTTNGSGNPKRVFNLQVAASFRTCSAPIQ